MGIHRDRQPTTPWTRETHILETVDIASSEYYHLGEFNVRTGQWETGVVYVNSDDDFVYIFDESVHKTWPLTAMTPEHVIVPYGEFDAVYYDEGDWYNYFVPGVGHIKWHQIEDTYTVTGELVDIHSPDTGESLWPLQVGQRHEYNRRDANDPTGWSVRYDVVGQADLGSVGYFELEIWNNDNDGVLETGYVRSTKNTLCGNKSVGEDYVEFRKAPVGTKWTLHQEDDGYAYKVIEIVAVESITVPYGQFDEAYKHRRYQCVDPNNLALGKSPDWYEWVVPGVGKVKEEDYWTDFPPAVMELVSIVQLPVVSFPDYMPTDPRGYGIKTFEWTHGKTGSLGSCSPQSSTALND